MTATVQLKLTPHQFDVLRDALEAAISQWEETENAMLDESRVASDTEKKQIEASLGKLANKMMVAASLRTQLSSG